jgi:hypothetical protein
LRWSGYFRFTAAGDDFPFRARFFATASKRSKNLDSIGNKVTRLILLEFFDFSALRIGNTISNMEAKPSNMRAGNSTIAGAQMRNARGSGRQCARATS